MIKNSSEKQEAFDSLLESVGAALGEWSEVSRSDRERAALDSLRTQLDDIDCRNSVPESITQLRKAYATWVLLSSLCGRRVLEAVGRSYLDIRYAASWHSSREALLWVLELHEGLFSPSERGVVDPVPLMIPRWLFLDMLEGMRALEKGETKQVFLAKRDVRHGETWTWDAMRMRAIEHVFFLIGSGLSRSASRRKVAAAMKTVSAGTLRDWEARVLPNVVAEFDALLETARAAGRLSIGLASQLDGTCLLDGSIDPYVQCALDGFIDEPLSMFGEKYFVKFGRRHNS